MGGFRSQLCGLSARTVFAISPTPFLCSMLWVCSKNYMLNPNVCKVLRLRPVVFHWKFHVDVPLELQFRDCATWIVGALVFSASFPTADKVYRRNAIWAYETAPCLVCRQHFSFCVFELRLIKGKWIQMPSETRKCMLAVFGLRTLAAMTQKILTSDAI